MSRRALWWMAVALLFGFLAIATAMRANLTLGLDGALLAAARLPGPTHALAGPAWTLPVLLDVTELGAATVRIPMTIAGALLLLVLRRQWESAALFFAVASAAAALPLVKALFHRARPGLAWHLAIENDWSFPSGHSLGSMVLYPLLGWFLLGLAGRRRTGLVLGVIVALAVGVTRVMLGVHWASDVAAAWCLGGAWTAAILALASGAGDQVASAHRAETRRDR